MRCPPVAAHEGLASSCDLRRWIRKADGNDSASRLIVGRARSEPRIDPATQIIASLAAAYSKAWQPRFLWVGLRPRTCDRHLVRGESVDERRKVQPLRHAFPLDFKALGYGWRSRGRYTARPPGLLSAGRWILSPFKEHN